MPLPDDQPHTRTRLPVSEQSYLQAPGRQARPLRTLLTVLVVVTLLVVAIAVANSGKSAPTGSAGSQHSAGAVPPQTSAPTAPSGDQPVGSNGGGAGSGYPHTEQGAQSAAANYVVALGGSDIVQSDSRRAAITAIADPAVADALRTRLDQTVTPAVLAGWGLDAQGKAPSGLTFVKRTVPIGTRTDGYTADSTRAMVWCLGLQGLAGVTSAKPVADSWYTVTVSLHWTGSDWKLTDLTTQNGPAPVVGDQQAASAEEIVATVQQFGGFRYAR